MNKQVFFFLGILTILLSACQMKNPSDKNQKISLNNNLDVAKNGVVAHRGAWKNKQLPKNSLAALQNAFLLGVTGSEYDLQLTADEVIVVNHDPDFGGMKIEESDYEDLLPYKLSNGEDLPKFETFLQAGMSQNKTLLITELKASTLNKERSLLLAEKVVEKVNELKANPWIIYISFDYDILRKIIQLDSSALTMYLGDNLSADSLARDNIYGADYHFSVFENNDSLINELRSRDLKLNVWTLNDSTKMDFFIDHDFDFYTSDEPEILLQKIKAKKLK